LLLLHYTFVRPKLEYDTPVSNSIKTADDKMVECVQWKFVGLFFSHIFPYNQVQIQVLWGVNFAQFLWPYKKGEYKIMITKLVTKVNI